jgi:cis-L-3-hydroxyproline dehydratase
MGEKTAKPSTDPTDELRSFPGRFLVRGSSRGDSSSSTKRQPRSDNDKRHHLLVSNVSLSFWGGIDPLTGLVIDQSHPLHGQNVTDTILCLPSGRGSCTASQVLLELILNGLAPHAIVLRDADGLVCVGALIAQEIFQHHTIPDIVCIGEDAYGDLWEQLEENGGDSSSSASPRWAGAIDNDGVLRIIGNDDVPRATTTILQGDEARATPLPYHEQPEPAQYNSAHETSLLAAAKTEAERMALRVIFRYAHILDDQPTYVPIVGSHIDGCTYIGPGGLAFVHKLVAANGRVKVPTTLNAVSADRQRWQALGVPELYARQSVALGDAYLQLGCQPSFTCAPYLLPNCTAPTTTTADDDGGGNVVDVAWGESNAVVYCNSVLGARTEKYADYLDICCAIAGLVPRVGVHVTTNRKPKVLLDASELMRTLLLGGDDDRQDTTLDLDLLFPILGHLCGTLSDGKVPMLFGLQDYAAIVTKDHLKSFCAAFGTTAASPLIHIAGITPEALDESTIEELLVLDDEDDDIVTTEVTMEQLEETYRELDSSSSSGGGSNNKDSNNGDDGDDTIPIDLIALGNPHLSVTECATLARLVTAGSNGGDGGAAKKADRTRIMACISRQVHASADPAHLVTLQKFGVEFVMDTCWCMLLDPPVIPHRPDATILTNSGKYAHYGPGLVQRPFRMGSLADCIETARTGVFRSRRRNNNGQQQQQHWLSARQTRTLATVCRRVFLRRYY